MDVKFVIRQIARLTLRMRARAGRFDTLPVIDIVPSCVFVYVIYIAIFFIVTCTHAVSHIYQGSVSLLLSFRTFKVSFSLSQVP